MKAITFTSDVVVYGTMAVCWVFILMYQFLTAGEWRYDPLGRHLMSLAFVDAAIFTMIGAANLWPWLGTQTWFLWSYIGVVAGIGIVTAWRLGILWRAYHPKEHDDVGN